MVKGKKNQKNFHPHSTHQAPMALYPVISQARILE